MTTAAPFDRQALERMNEKAIQNQFFTPDHVYMDLALFKEIPLGVVYADCIVLKRDQDYFEHIQKQIVSILPDYQTRLYDSVDRYLSPLGYTDQTITNLMYDQISHDTIFLMAPATYFFETMIRHTIRNQNNSRPANKYTKTKIDKEHYAVSAIPVTYYINTYPLALSPERLVRLGQELGEAWGVNIRFLNKDPQAFDEQDWNDWLERIDCFYLHDLNRFTSGQMNLAKFEALAFAGRYIFARKRFDKHVEHAVTSGTVDLEQEIQIVTARLDLLCDFAWLQNTDVRLTDMSDAPPLLAPA